jgi:uncharacterized protein YkwD
LPSLQGVVGGELESIDGGPWHADDLCEAGTIFDLNLSEWVEVRMALEFANPTPPSGASVRSATLSLYHASGNGLDQLVLYGYPGNGRIEEADAVVVGEPVRFAAGELGYSNLDVTGIMTPEAVAGGWAGFSIRADPPVLAGSGSGQSWACVWESNNPILTVAYDTGATPIRLPPIPSGTPASQPPETPATPTGTDSGEFDVAAAESTVWELIQATRANSGLPPLTLNDTLMSIARWRSRDMIERSYFSHTILDTGYQVFHWYDLNGLDPSLASESIGWNSGYADADSPIAVHNGLMDVPRDRSNILHPQFTEVGIGVAGSNNVNFLGTTRNPRIYTLLFLGSEPDSTPPQP